MSPPPVISVEKAGGILRVSRSKVLRLIGSGKIQARVVGTRGQYQVYYASVLRYLERQAKEKAK